MGDITITPEMITDKQLTLMTRNFVILLAAHFLAGCPVRQCLFGFKVEI
jgi:hypothetical protein